MLKKQGIFWIKEEGNKKIKEKGFTLIELLAVIIILGILMLIAIPSVTNYIANSRKKTYVAAADGYVDEVRTKVNSSDYSFTDPNTTYYVHINNVDLEKGGRSPFGEWLDAYVVVVIDDKGVNYDYYWVSIDKAGFRVSLKNMEDITAKDVIVSSDKTISTTRAIGSRTKVYIIDKDGNIIHANGGIELTEVEAKECFEFAFAGNTATITSYNDTCSKDVIIPSRIEGYAVTSIGAQVFYNKAIKSVIIPEGIVSIGDSAFYNNQLTSLILPSTLKTIGGSTFRNNKLTSVIIPNGVTSIGALAFAGNLLTDISLPSSVTSLGGGSFSNNKIPEQSAMIYKQKSDGTPDYSVIVGYAGESKSIIISGEKNGVTLKEISNTAFYALGLTSVVIPDSVETIGTQAFDSNKLTSVTLPANLKNLNYAAFRGNQLTAVTIPPSVTFMDSAVFTNNQFPTATAFIYGRNSDGTTDYSTLLSYAGADRSNVIIPATANGVGLKKITRYAFHGGGITGLTIPNTSLVTIETGAFSSNKLPDSQAFIYGRKADGTPDYSTIVGYGGTKKDNVVVPRETNGVLLTTIASNGFNYGYIKSITLPDTLTTIGSSAFTQNYLTTITIPSNVTSIAANAFPKTNSTNKITKIINQTGRSFNWQSITGGNFAGTFVTGTIKHQFGDIIIVNE